MTPKQQEAFEAVKKINQELSEKYKKLSEKDVYKDWLSRKPIVTFLLADDMFFIGLSLVSYNNLNLPEIDLYNSVNDDRIYYEKSDKYESYYKLIKRKFIQIKEEIYSIKL